MDKNVIYVVLTNYDYEGYVVHGIFEHLEDAKKCSDENHECPIKEVEWGQPNYLWKTVER
jgi:hypothetical protein